MSEYTQPPVIALYGALRSGTTLFRLILKNHPALFNPGETDYLLDHIRPDPDHPTGWRYDLGALGADRIFRAQHDSLPEGVQGRDLTQALVSALSAHRPDGQAVLVFHRNAEKLAALFPEARILHLVRDPRDVARSSIGMGWAGNSYFGVDHWIDTEKSWDEAGVDSARVLDVRFEALMAGLKEELVRICDFLGLSFDPVMLTYHETSTYGPPDPSIAQKWRKTAPPREIARIESKLGALLEARGYAPAGTSERPGPLASAALATSHRINRWRFNIRRYGPGLFFAQHGARLLGLRRVADDLSARQEAIRMNERQ